MLAGDKLKLVIALALVAVLCSVVWWSVVACLLVGRCVIMNTQYDTSVRPWQEVGEADDDDMMEVLPEAQPPVWTVRGDACDDDASSERWFAYLAWLTRAIASGSGYQRR